jgi:ketosteroid isomerase-like protein
MDGDGDMDVVGAAVIDDDIAWFENNGSQSFTERTIEGDFDGAYSVYAVDMDGDGDMDVVAAAEADDDIAWFENNGSQSFTERTIEGNFNGAISVYATDMDGDGDMDVVGAAFYDDDIAWFENNGSQSFTERTIEGNFDGAMSVYATDMDGDGDMDVVGAEYQDNDIAWFENNGSQSFTEHTIAGDFSYARSVYAVDIDGDGDMDVVGASNGDDDISWWENTSITPSLPTFTESTIEGGFGAAMSVYAVDMDGDGDMDVVGAAYSDDDIAWFENNGSQSFTERTIEGDFDGAYSVYAVDMDGDGDMDVIGAALVDDDIAWFENNGSQSFTERTIEGDFDGVRSVYAVDMDGDGDMDVVGAAYEDDDIAWFENNGSQSFTEHTIAGDFDGPQGTRSVYAADMDGDGDMDVVGAALNANDISWWENKVTVVSGNAGFRMLSSPVAGTIYDELLAPFWIQGMTNGDTESGTANVWTYNAGTSAWTSLSNLTTDSYTAGAGILIYVFTDVDGDGDDDIAGGVNVGIVNGTENSATVSISTTASAWNLLGNPFVSTIGADQLFSDNSNYTSTVYVYDDANSQYNTWNGSTGGLSNGLIAPYQGFWIQSGSSGTTFQFTSSCKSSSIGTFYKTMNDSSGSVAFQFSSGSYSSTAYLSFNIDALEGIDNADAYKLLPLGASDHLTSIFYVGEVALNISNLPYDVTNSMAADMDVMLLTAASDSFYTSTGNVSMSWDIGNLPAGKTIYLVDQLTLNTLDLQTEDSYSFDLQEKGGFSATGDTNQALYPRQGQNRFQVLINSTTVSVDEELLPIQYALHPAYPNPFNPITSLRYDLPEQAKVTLTIYDLMGREITQLVNTTQEAGYRSVKWNATDMHGKPVSAGIYLYQIRTADFVQTRKMVLLK